MKLLSVYSRIEKKDKISWMIGARFSLLEKEVINMERERIKMKPCDVRLELEISV